MGPLFQSHLNFLLVLLPLALISATLSLPPDVTLAFSFLAIVSLSGPIQLSCEHISASLNDTLGKLLVAFSDNIVEFVVSGTHKKII